VGNGNVDVGNKTAIRKPERAKVCVQMSQQCSDSGHQSAPQKFVQLVGYRDPKGRAEPWVRPGPAPVKR
jgi:hypothetical protein